MNMNIKPIYYRHLSNITHACLLGQKDKRKLENSLRSIKQMRYSSTVYCLQLSASLKKSKWFVSCEWDKTEPRKNINFHVLLIGEDWIICWSWLINWRFYIYTYIIFHRSLRQGNSIILLVSLWLWVFYEIKWSN